MRIFLVGFMGAGKTTLGKLLAEVLHFEFVDLDARIETMEMASINDIFSVQGETYFRETEAALLRTLVGMEDIVVATGGGTPCYHDSMSWMNEHGISIYLKADVQMLLERLRHGRNQRALIQFMDAASLTDYIDTLLKKRAAYYEQAMLTVDASATIPFFLEHCLNYIQNCKQHKFLGPGTL